jgi:5-methylcytosine-specific restriction endonuclease McrA
MPRRSQPGDVAAGVAEVRRLLSEFTVELQSGDLRRKVQSLVPVMRELRDLGSSLIPRSLATGGKERVLVYMRQYPRTVIAGEELDLVSGIGEWARRVRELRVESGWSIASGAAVRDMVAAGDLPAVLENGERVEGMPVDSYILLSDEQDRDAAHRWYAANGIRKGSGSVRDKILAYMRANIGRAVTGEELRYVANNRTEWARRVRELRTEHGWPVVTRQTRRPDMAVGTYMLEADRQTPEHDRKISDKTRFAVLERDGWRCVSCGWDRSKWQPEAPRNLELHHVKPHAEGGENTEDNLQTLCNVCHDEVHAK